MPIDAKLWWAVAELFRGTAPVAVGAKAANVAVVVRSASRERHNMVRHGAGDDEAALPTVPAEGLEHQPTAALLLPGAAAKAFDALHDTSPPMGVGPTFWFEIVAGANGGRCRCPLCSI